MRNALSTQSDSRTALCKFHFLSEAGRPSEESARTRRVSSTFFARPNGLAQKVEFEGLAPLTTSERWQKPRTHLLRAPPGPRLGLHRAELVPQQAVLAVGLRSEGLERVQLAVLRRPRAEVVVPGSRLLPCKFQSNRTQDAVRCAGSADGWKFRANDSRTPLQNCE